MDLANTEDEVPPPESEEDTESEDEQDYQTRNGRISKTRTEEEQYPALYYTDDKPASETDKSDAIINLVKVKEEYQHYVKSMKWLDVDQGDITTMVFATKQMSIQDGMRKYKDEGNDC